MIRFGLLDIERAQEVATEYGVLAIPQFRIFSSQGDIEYVGKRKEKNFLNHAASFIEDLSQQVEASWVDSMLARPSAVLFTDKPKTPPIWSGISTYFYGKSIRIGIARDPEILTLFNVSSTPTILFMNGTGSLQYEGKVEFNSLKAGIEKYFERRLQAETETPDSDFLSPATFSGRCLGGRSNCILYVAEKPGEVFERLAKRFAKRKMFWFVGAEDLPFQFMKKGGVWIYNPRKDGFLHVETVEKMDEVMDRVLDGGAKWIGRATLTEESL
jgi:thioredoxin-related protein